MEMANYTNVFEIYQDELEIQRQQLMFEINMQYAAGVYSGLTSTTASDGSATPVDLLPTFDEFDSDLFASPTGTSRGFYGEQSSPVQAPVKAPKVSEPSIYDAFSYSSYAPTEVSFDGYEQEFVPVLDIASEHARVMAAATLQEKRKLAKKFASLLQVNGIAIKAFSAFERGDESVRMMMNIILFKAGLNVQSVMEQHWEEVAAITNSRGVPLRNLMDHQKRLKNYFEVKFQEYAGALSWDLSPKMGSPVAVRAAKEMQYQAGDKKAMQARLVADLDEKNKRVQVFKKNLWGQFEQFIAHSEMAWGQESRQVLDNLMHPANEQKRVEVFTSFVENPEVARFTTGFVECNGLVVVTKKVKVTKL